MYGDDCLDCTGRLGLLILHVFWNTRDLVECALAEDGSLPACHYLKPQGCAVVEARAAFQSSADHVSTHLESA